MLHIGLNGLQNLLPLFAITHCVLCRRDLVYLEILPMGKKRLD